MHQETPKFSGPSEYEDDSMIPAKLEKIYGTDSTGHTETGGSVRPSELHPKIRIVGEQKKKIGWGTIPVKRLSPEPGWRVKEGVYDEEDHNDFILQKPVYEEDEKPEITESL